MSPSEYSDQESLKGRFFSNLEKRRQSGGTKSAPDTKTGLVVQGGGMRGLYSASALNELSRQGYGTAFDHVFGSSSGAINGTYFVSGQESELIGGYIEAAASGKLIRFARLSNIVDVDYLIDYSLKRKYRIDEDRFFGSDTTMHIVTTDYEAFRTRIFTNRERNYDIYEVLRATAAIPIFYNKPVIIGGRRYMDGGVLSALPLMEAIEKGCTDILVITTYPLGVRSEKLPFIIRQMIDIFYKNYSDRVLEVVKGPDRRFNRVMEMVSNPNAMSNIRLQTIAPGDAGRMVGRLTRRRARLESFVDMAVDDVKGFFEAASGAS